MLQRSTLPSPPPLDGLERLALFLDFDGTLVDIADGPDAIDVPDDLGQRIAALSNRLDGRLAVVTGRSLDNLEQFLGLCPVYRAGSHGAHVVTPQGEALQAAKALPEAVINQLSDFAQANGLLYERKPHGGALHYRAKPELEAQVKAISTQIADEHGLAAKSGKCVVELVWPGADKGGATRLLADQPECANATPIFIGDDVTDEDGMLAAKELGGFGIAVGERPSDAATYHLSTVKDVHTWLKL